MIKRRLAKLEATRKKQGRRYVVHVQDGETTEEALARCQDDVTVRDISDQPMTADEWEKQYCRGVGTH